MPAAGWSYGDWIRSSLYPVGTQARLDRLELHIEEVQNRISSGNFSVEGRSQDKDLLERYLKSLKESDLPREQASSAAATGTQTTFVRGVPTRPGDGNA